MGIIEDFEKLPAHQKEYIKHQLENQDKFTEAFNTLFDYFKLGSPADVPHILAEKNNWTYQEIREHFEKIHMMIDWFFEEVEDICDFEKNHIWDEKAQKYYEYKDINREKSNR